MAQRICPVEKELGDQHEERKLKRIAYALEALERQEDYQKYVNSGADEPWSEE